MFESVLESYLESFKVMNDDIKRVCPRWLESYLESFKGGGVRAGGNPGLC